MECVHCGREAQGYASIGKARVCHPNSRDGYPDCYRRVTVYGEILGILKVEQKFPYGVEKIMDRGWAVQELTKLSEELGLYDE